MKRLHYIHSQQKDIFKWLSKYLPILSLVVDPFGNKDLLSFVVDPKLVQSTESSVEQLAPIPCVEFCSNDWLAWGSASTSCEVLRELPMRNFNLKGAIVSYKYWLIIIICRKIHKRTNIRQQKGYEIRDFGKKCYSWSIPKQQSITKNGNFVKKYIKLLSGREKWKWLTDFRNFRI